jgi:hypothetical protein
MVLGMEQVNGRVSALLQRTLQFNIYINELFYFQYKKGNGDLVLPQMNNNLLTKVVLAFWAYIAGIHSYIYLTFTLILVDTLVVFILIYKKSRRYRSTLWGMVCELCNPFRFCFYS